MLDGVVSLRVIDGVTVTTVPIEDGADVADGVQEEARLVLMDVVVSESPLPAEIETRGPERIAEVLDYLAASVGELVTLTATDRPTYRDLLLTSRGSPEHDARSRSSRLSVTLQQSRIVRARDTATEAPLTQARAGRGTAAGAEREDRGDVPTKRTVLKSSVQALRGAVGL